MSYSNKTNKNSEQEKKVGNKGGYDMINFDIPEVATGPKKKFGARIKDSISRIRDNLRFRSRMRKLRKGR